MGSRPLNKLCSVTDCTNRSVSKNLCYKHGYRYRRYGHYDLSHRKGPVERHPLYSKWTNHVRNNCEGWDNKFWNFVESVGAGPSERHVIQRINPAVNWSPTNFKWEIPARIVFNSEDPKALSRFMISKKTPEYEFRAFLRSYGFKSAEEYENLVKVQNGVCAICSQPETVMRRGKVQRLSVDHCHKTNKIRGLLCVTCNNILGNAHDSVDKLKNAIKYLEREED